MMLGGSRVQRTQELDKAPTPICHTQPVRQHCCAPMQARLACLGAKERNARVRPQLAGGSVNRQHSALHSVGL